MEFIEKNGALLRQIENATDQVAFISIFRNGRILPIAVVLAKPAVHVPVVRLARAPKHAFQVLDCRDRVCLFFMTLHSTKFHLGT